MREKKKKLQEWNGKLYYAAGAEELSVRHILIQLFYRLNLAKWKNWRQALNKVIRVLAETKIM